jgi:hypothetical protein
MAPILFASPTPATKARNSDITLSYESPPSVAAKPVVLLANELPPVASNNQSSTSNKKTLSRKKIKPLTILPLNQRNNDEPVTRTGTIESVLAALIPAPKSNSKKKEPNAPNQPKNTRSKSTPGKQASTVARNQPKHVVATIVRVPDKTPSIFDISFLKMLLAGLVLVVGGIVIVATGAVNMYVGIALICMGVVAFGSFGATRYFKR